jgi:redox-sensitive bicupin YhaK (pirin superfamily)
MLDHFKVRLPAGFPDHPHRGFETVTYMQEGVMHHEDFKGHKGTIGPGDIQWMTAGKGIVHAEMPGSTEQDSVGFQLWLNLKSKDKMQEPQYQEYTKDQIPVFEKDGTKVKIICGEWEGHSGPIKYHTPSYYMDIKLPKDGKFQIPIKKLWNSIIYVYEGAVEYSCAGAKHELNTNYCCVLEKSKN